MVRDHERGLRFKSYTKVLPSTFLSYRNVENQAIAPHY
jgi:hypothetical protein